MAKEVFMIALGGVVLLHMAFAFVRRMKYMKRRTVVFEAMVIAVYSGGQVPLAVAEYIDRKGRRKKFRWEPISLPSLGQCVKLTYKDGDSGEIIIATRSYHIFFLALEFVAGLLALFVGILKLKQAGLS
ncbi:MAG: hypothetical protein LBM92_07130 [Opitutaceae bacterium]|nr:hypothetical protein [Opitutaceae bacterium]